MNQPTAWQPPERWLAPDGSTLACRDKIKVLNENLIELRRRHYHFVTGVASNSWATKLSVVTSRRFPSVPPSGTGCAECDQRVIVGMHAQCDVLGAEQHRVERFMRNRCDQFRASREFGAHDLPRQLRGRDGERARHVLLQPVEFT